MKILPKTSNPSRFLIGLLIILCVAVSIGCAAKAKDNRDPAGSLLAKSIDYMKKTGSYHFKGTGFIKYPSLNERGTFAITGEYKNPASSHIILEMTLGNASYHAETFYRNQVFYSLLQDSWTTTPFDPNILLQPAYKPINLILDQMEQVSAKPVFEEDVRVNGRFLRVIHARSNLKKLKSLMQKEFDKAISLEPERRQGITSFLKNLTVEHDYILYVEPVSGIIERLQFNQIVRLNLPTAPAESQLSINYTLNDFGADVTMPSVPAKTPMK